MYKLVILIEQQDNLLKYEEMWPDFLAAAERMPGLRRETASPVQAQVFGDIRLASIHEFFFADRAAVRDAMASPAGQQAGKILQHITGGKVSLLIAEHLEENAIADIRPAASPPQEGPPNDKT